MSRHPVKKAVKDPKLVVAINGVINASAAARLAGCAPATIIRWCEAGLLKGERRGKQWRIPAEQFQRFRID